MEANDVELTVLRSRTKPTHRRNRGVWIRFVLAVTPTVVFAILGYLQTH